MIYEEFLRDLFEDEAVIREAVFCGKSVIGKIDDQIIVKIALVSTERNSRIDALLCTILNRYGVIDKQMYQFVEMIRSAPILRETDSTDDLAEKFSEYDMERIREIVLGYIGKFYDKYHDKEGREDW